MNIEKIEINGHYVWVDKDAEIKKGDAYLSPSGIWFYNLLDPNHVKDCNKIVAASPELKLEGVPDYVEWLAKKTITASEGVEVEILRTVWIHGFETAEKELPTDEEIYEKYSAFISTEVTLGFLTKEQGERLKWYYQTYLVNEIQGGNK